MIDELVMETNLETEIIYKEIEFDSNHLIRRRSEFEL